MRAILKDEWAEFQEMLPQELAELLVKWGEDQTLWRHRRF
jgi:hypothetical protein